jgi:periplasmic divalent cation tolerance protein
LSIFTLIFVTTPSRDEAERIASALIGRGLAPCINIIPSCLSLYQWKGEVCRDEESLMIIKSRKDLFPKVKEVVEELHSYDVPEVVAVPLDLVSEKYGGYLEEYFE